MVSREAYDDLEKSLSDLYAEVPSPPAGLRSARAKMLTEAAELSARQVVRPLSTDKTGNTTRRRKMNLMLAYKALAVVLAMAVAITGMGGGVVFAADSLPGDFLYPVKLLSEDVRLALAPDPSARAELGMAFVDLRVQEMVRLAQQGEEVRQAEVERMTRQMEQVMAEIAKARPEEAPALLERLIERTRLHQQVLEHELSQMQTRLWEAIQLMERTRLNAENDPLYLEYQHQYQYQGASGPHGEVSPPPQGTGEQNQEQNQNSYQGEQGAQGTGEQNQEQNQNSYQGEQGAQGTGEQNQEQNQNSYQGEQGAQGSGEQNQEQTQEQTQQQTQEQTQQQTQEQTQDQTQQQSPNR